MFKKHLKLKKATKYPQPKYPVMESGEVLSTPKELRLADLARPLAPVVLSATLAFSDARGAAVADARPAIVGSIGGRALVAPSRQETQDAPYRIRKFSEKEIQSLLEELKLQMDYPENVRGRVALRMPPLTETQGREILMRFFAKNGIRLQSGVAFRKGEVDFELDGYDGRKKIGFEFIPVSGETDLSSSEIAAVEKGIEGEHLFIQRETPTRLPSPREVVLRLEKAASTFLERLYRDEVLGRTREIERHLGDLLSSDATASARAGEALREIGIEALWWLRKKADDERVKPILAAVYQERVRPLLDALDDDRIEARDEATRKLIDAGPVVTSYVEERLRESKGNAEIESRCAAILQAFREERP